MVRQFLRILLILAGLACLGWLVYNTTTILAYLLISMVVALIGRPLFNLFERIQIRGKHLPDSIKAAGTLLVIFGILSTLLSTFLPMIFTEAQLLTKIDLDQINQALGPALDSLNGLVSNIYPDNSHEFSEEQLIQYLFESLDLTALPDILNSVVGALGNLLIALFSIAFISFFLLKDKNLITDVALNLIPKSKEKGAKRILLNSRRTLSRYFLGLLLQVIAITICIFIGLSIVGVQNALLIAVFTGIVNLVPYLGPWIGASFGLFILAANNLDASFTEVIQPKMIGLICVFAATQLLDNYLFQPTIFSKSINAHPLEIFFVILIAGSIGGVGGMIVAIPVYSLMRIVFVEMNREFRWLERIKEK